MTVRDLINGSFRLLGVLASGESPSSQEQTDAFNALNDLVDSLSNNRLFIYNITEESFSFLTSKQTYTMGPSGDFDTTRPQKIENVNIVVSGTEDFELPMKLINKDEWAQIKVKTVDSPLPRRIYPDYAYPLINLNFWPIPSTTNSVKIWSWKAIADFATVDTTLSLPPGYQRLLRYNLALELAPEYGVTPSNEVREIARKSIQEIEAMNLGPQYLDCDPAVLGSSKAFNYYTGDSE